MYVAVRLAGWFVVTGEFKEHLIPQVSLVQVVPVCFGPNLDIKNWLPFMSVSVNKNFNQTGS